ncbi:MAG: VWA domain-containing protein [Dehalococcoidia bacterium]|nr:VWA domain-containing protein [Chloroflexota bacterium]MYK25815.1 VWA domain-containing protein [Dehalococcoidia bacterium]
MNQQRTRAMRRIRRMALPLLALPILAAAVLSVACGDDASQAESEQPTRVEQSTAQAEQQQSMEQQVQEAEYQQEVAVQQQAQEAEHQQAASAEYEQAEAEEAMQEEVAEESVESSSGGTESQLSSLSAGEVNDNERWDEYLRYRSEYSYLPVHDVDISERYIISVKDSAGRSLPNARVTVSAGDMQLFDGVTYADGRTLFFPRAFPGTEAVQSFTLEVERNGYRQQIDMQRGETGEWSAELDLQRELSESVPLDILFLLDATGSMEDEIEQIKDTLLSIASRINDLPSQPDLRFGMVAYRDRGDAFVTRVYDFEDDANKFLDTIRSVHAGGGNDYPESLNQALHEAVHLPQWRLEDGIRLMFLIADAPPHLDYANDYSYAQEMMEAHSRGIKTFAIASSGLDPQGEYIFRQIAQHTMGRFIFIVYGDGGTTPHNVGQYTVERLDDLVVSLVEEELAFLADTQ